MKGSLVSQGDVTQGTGEVSGAIYFESPHWGESHANSIQHNTSTFLATTRARVDDPVRRRHARGRCAVGVQCGQEREHANRTKFRAVHGRSSYRDHTNGRELWYGAH